MRPEWLIKCSLILVCISSLGVTKEREMYVAYHDIMFIWNEAKVMGNISLYTGKSILKHYPWMHFPEVTIWLLEHRFLYRSDASWFLFLAFFVSRPRPSLTVQSAAFSLLWIGQRVASASLELELQWELSDHTAWDMLLKSIQSEFFSAVSLSRNVNVRNVCTTNMTITCSELTIWQECKCVSITDMIFQEKY